MGSEGSVALSDAIGEARRATDEELRPKGFGAGSDEMAARRPVALLVAHNVLPVPRADAVLRCGDLTQVGGLSITRKLWRCLAVSMQN
jgi:hypothetical protein